MLDESIEVLRDFLHSLYMLENYEQESEYVYQSHCRCLWSIFDCRECMKAEGFSSRNRANNNQDDQLHFHQSEFSQN